MALVAFTSTITAADLNANFDDKTTALLTNARSGRKDGVIPLRLGSLASSADLSLRSIAWTQQDDHELRVITIRATDTAARAISATLTVDNADTTFLVDQTISVALTTVNGTADARTDFRTTTGTRVRLLKGVRYRLAIVNTSGGTVGGPLQATIQVRTGRRSEGLRNQVPLVPRRFRNTENLDVEALNDDLDAIARDIRANLDARYTYSPPIFLALDGVTDTSTAVLRELAIRRQASGLALEVCSYELVIYAAGTVVWTLTPSDTTLPTITATAAGATTEARSEITMPVPVTSSTSDILFTASGAAASTITRGYIVVHTRADRGNMGTSHAGYTPVLFDAQTARSGATLDTELTGLGNAYDRDTANDIDMRVELFAIRSLASGSAVSLLLPSGLRRIVGTVGYIVGAANSVATITVTGTGLTGSSVAVTATGETARVAGTDTASGSMNNTPTTSADDATVTITISGGVTADLAYVIIFWT